MNRIFYATDSPLISGGHYVLRDHVIGLRSLGLEAYVLASKRSLVKEYARFMAEDWVVVADKGLPVNPEDYVVIPEPWRDLINLLQKINVKKILHVQNPFYIFHGFSSVNSLNEYGLSSVISCSTFTTSYLCNLRVAPPVFTVRPKIDNVFFKSFKKHIRVCYMPRKRRIEAEFIRGLFSSMYPRLASVEWISIDGISRDAAAEIMCSSRVFLSLNRLDGLGLPPLEAMAAGCIPVGFAGGGGAEYATAANGYWHSEEDYIGIVHSIALVLGFDEKTDVLSMMREKGRITADDFSNEKFLASLHNFWQPLVPTASQRITAST